MSEDQVTKIIQDMMPEHMNKLQEELLKTAELQSERAIKLGQVDGIATCINLVNQLIPYPAIKAEPIRVMKLEMDKIHAQYKQLEQQINESLGVPKSVIEGGQSSGK